MLHLREVVRAASLRTLLPRKLIRKFRRFFAVAPMTWVLLLLGLRAVSGRIACSHQHMRPCTLHALLHFPRQRKGATPDAMQQSKPSCQNKMLRRKRQQVRPSALRSQKACAQIASLHANIDFEPASSELQSKSSRCMAASSLFFALYDFSEGCWVSFICSFRERGFSLHSHLALHFRCPM